MQPYHQGQLDFLCPVYAVINLLSSLFPLNLSRGREILASTLEDISAHPRLWDATLRNKTDFYWLTPYVLARTRTAYRYPIRVFRPFGPTPQEDPLPPGCLDLESAALYCPEEENQGFSHPEVWDALEQWFSKGGEKRRVLLRFQRFLPYTEDPVIRHWTVGESMRNNALRFRDASRDSGAVFALKRQDTDIDARPEKRRHLLVLEPASLYFIERP